MSLLSVPAMVALGAFLSAFGLMAAVWSWVSASVPAPLPPVPRAVVAPQAPDRLLRTLGYLAQPVDTQERASQVDLLAQAGWTSPQALPIYLASRVVLAFALPMLGWVLFSPETVPGMLFLGIEAAALGYYLPHWVVGGVRSSRQRRIRRAVPNLLDMLVSCVDAGLGIDVALRHVASEIAVASPELSAELMLVNAEMSAGIPRADALRLLEHRTGVEDLTALVNLLGMVERFGSGISQSLRAHANLTRRRRALEAEQRAAKASPILTVVMVLFILPALFVVLLGSAIVDVTAFVLPSIAGGRL